MIDNDGGLPTRAEFSEWLGSSFRNEPNDTNTTELELVECNTVVDDDVQETFSLVFRAPIGVSPDQRIYTLANGNRRFDVFLVPIKHTDEGLFFEAVFNRLK
jgi:hypothetical protein